MSFANKGSMVATVVVTQDGTGNFTCSGVNDQVEITLAIAEATARGSDTVYFKAGTYDVNNLIIVSATRLVAAEDGVVFSLPATPSISVDYTTTFKRIEFLSTFNGNGHIDIDADTTFEDCDFDFELDTVGLAAVIRNTTADTEVRFIRCKVLQGGESGGEYFCFFETATDMDLIMVDGFEAWNLIADGTVGRIVMFYIQNTPSIKLLIGRDIEVWDVTADYAGNAFFYGNDGRCNVAKITNFTFYGGGAWGDANSHFQPVYRELGIHQEIDGLFCYDRVHCYGGKTTSLLTNFIIIGDGTYSSGFDHPTSTGYPRADTVSNGYLKDASLDFNSGSMLVNVNNVTFDGSRMTFLDEDGNADPIYANLSNINFYDSTIWNYCILLSYGQDLNLPKIHLDHINSVNKYQFMQIAGTPTSATHISIDQLYHGPRVGANNPIFINPGVRDNDDQRISISNSEIWADVPPLGSWNNIRTLDEFHKVIWHETGASTTEYSENGGTAVIPNLAAVIAVTHNLIVDPSTWGSINVTGAEQSAECDDLVVHTVGAAQFTIETMGGAVSADRDVFWRAHIKR